MARWYEIRVDIYEEDSDVPVVTHIFRGGSKQEAFAIHEAHRHADAFLRQCEDRGRYGKSVQCQAVLVYSKWVSG